MRPSTSSTCARATRPTRSSRRPTSWWARTSVTRTAAGAALLALLVAAPGPVHGRPVTDSAGRTVEVPARVERVFAAGGPASIILYTLAPELMLGWNRAPSPEERAF